MRLQLERRAAGSHEWKASVKLILNRMWVFWFCLLIVALTLALVIYEVWMKNLTGP